LTAIKNNLVSNKDSDSNKIIFKTALELYKETLDSNSEIKNKLTSSSEVTSFADL
jgi:hypothetical protein